MSLIRHRSVYMLTDIAVPVKEDHVDASRAVHVAQPAAGVPTDRELPARPDGCCGEAEKLQDYLPTDDPRLRLAPATVIATVVRNIVAGHRPVYALGEWAAPYDPTVLGLAPGEVDLFHIPASSYNQI